MPVQIDQYPQFDPISKNQLKYYRALKTKKYRKKELKYIVEGIRSIEEAVAAAIPIEAILFCPDYIKTNRGKQLLTTAGSKGITIRRCDKKAFKSLSDTINSQGFAGIIPNPQKDLDLKNFSDQVIFVALNGVSDPGNAGTVVRTCDWFGVQAVLFDLHTVELHNPKTLRSTAGSIFHIPVYEGIDLLSIIPRLKAEGFQIYSTDVHGVNEIRELSPPEKLLLIFGNEGDGIAEDILALSDQLLNIKGRGSAESLNVAVSTGIILASLFDNKNTNTNQENNHVRT
jgi:TrmH family RNA methyltransferase